MFDLTELDLICRTRAERIAWINAEGYRKIAARTTSHAIRRTLALAAVRVGTWLDPSTGADATVSGRPAEQAIA